MNIGAPKLLCWLGVMAASVLLGGCSATGLHPDVAKGVRSVGVISLLPDKLRYERVGDSAFHGAQVERPVGDAFNEAARAGAREALGSSARIGKVIPIRDGLGRLAERFPAGPANATKGMERVKSDLAAIAARHGVDALLVFSEDRDGDAKRSGIRVLFPVNRDNLRYAYLEANLVLHMVDRNGEVMAVNPSVAASEPVRPLKGDAWAFELEKNVTRREHERLSKAATDAVRQEAARRVQALGVGK